MLTDPVIIKVATGAGSGADLTAFIGAGAYITDVSPGSVTRVINQSGLPTGFTGRGGLKISHSETKENPGLITDRTLIRFDFNVEGSGGVQSVASAYAVLALPRVPLLDMDAVGLLVAKTLALFLAYGPGGAEGSSDEKYTKFDEDTTLPAIIGGQG